MQEHIKIIEENEPPYVGKMNIDRMKVAMLVHQNDEWRDYVVKEIESLRTKALMEDVDGEVDRDVLMDRLMDTRGRIMALTDAFKHFENCFSTVRRETDNQK